MFASHKVVTVIVYILLDEPINEFCLTAKFSILNHRVNDLLSSVGVILTIRVEVGYEFKDIGYIYDIAMQKFQAEVDVAKSCLCSCLWIIFGNHARVFLWFLITILIVATSCKGVVNIKIFAAEVHKLLFGHDKVGSILLKLVINLYFSVFLDNITEGKYKLLLVVLALQIVYIMRFGIMLQEVLCQFLIVFFDIIKWWAHNFYWIAITEKFDGLIHLAFQVTEANHLTETLLLVQHTVGTAERLQQSVILHVFVNIESVEFLAVKASKEHTDNQAEVKRLHVRLLFLHA